MKATLIGKEKNLASFKVVFEAEEFTKAVQQAYAANKDKFAVDGFRKGKAPRKLIEAKYGDGIFYEDALDRLFMTAYPTALMELNLDPVDNPSVDFEGKVEEGKDLTVIISVTVRPEVELKDYKGIKIEKIETPVTDEDVQRDLEMQQRRNSRMVVVDRAAKEGDTVMIDYAGFVGEEQFEGGTAERQPLNLGSGTFIPGFEEQLVGLSAGEEKDVVVTFPTEYHAENLAGKEAVFKCKVHEVKETELPELNDDFAKDVSEFDTLDELKASIRERLEEQNKMAANVDMKNKMLETLSNATEIDIPEAMVEDEIDRTLAEFDQRLQYQGMSLEMYLQYLGQEMAEFRKGYRDNAFKKVKSTLIVEAVVAAENIEVSAEEIEAEMKQLAEAYGMELDKVKEILAQNMEGLKKDIANRKAVDFLFENAVIA
ncbi:MAG: trigger factor [Clostridiales bacterium]|nr:trigger factor [Clostridiales bacterium]